MSGLHTTYIIIVSFCQISPEHHPHTTNTIAHPNPNKIAQIRTIDILHLRAISTAVRCHSKKEKKKMLMVVPTYNTSSTSTSNRMLIACTKICLTTRPCLAFKSRFYCQLIVGPNRTRNKEAIRRNVSRYEHSPSSGRQQSTGGDCLCGSYKRTKKKKEEKRRGERGPRCSQPNRVSIQPKARISEYSLTHSPPTSQCIQTTNFTLCHQNAIDEIRIGYNFFFSIYYGAEEKIGLTSYHLRIYRHTGCCCPSRSLSVWVNNILNT